MHTFTCMLTSMYTVSHGEFAPTNIQATPKLHAINTDGEIATGVN